MLSASSRASSRVGQCLCSSSCNCCYVSSAWCGAAGIAAWRARSRSTRSLRRPPHRRRTPWSAHQVRMDATTRWPRGACLNVAPRHCQYLLLCRHCHQCAATVTVLAVLRVSHRRHRWRRWRPQVHKCIRGCCSPPCHRQRCRSPRCDTRRREVIGCRRCCPMAALPTCLCVCSLWMAAPCRHARCHRSQQQQPTGRP